MKIRNLASNLLGYASRTALSFVFACIILATLGAVTQGCGEADDQVEASKFALGVTVGTHRAIGSYTCQVTPFSTLTWSASTNVYISQLPLPHRWQIQLNHDDAATGVNLANHQSWPTEASDNGIAVYTTADTTLYIHKQPGIWGYEYTHDEDTPPTEVQYYPHVLGDNAHPLGQLVVTMYPQGSSDPAWGECTHAVTAYLTLQP